ncbi:MAG: hypothetical protein P8170_07610 [Gemmatimonadota bacterium]
MSPRPPVFRSVARRNPPIAEGQSVRSRVYEGVTIALSILVAFGIDAAWGEWNETREEQRILTSLLDELIQNERYLETAVALQSDIRAAIVELLSQAALPQATISADSTDRLIATASTWNAGAIFELAAVDAVIQGGRLSILSNEDLRQRLTAWSREVAHVSRVESQDHETVSSDWMPLLQELSYLPQINNAWQNPPGTMTDYATRLPTRTPTDHRRLLNDQRLENALVRRLWAQDDILFRYEEIRPRIGSMIELLGQETGR